MGTWGDKPQDALGASLAPVTSIPRDRDTCSHHRAHAGTDTLALSPAKCHRHSVLAALGGSWHHVTMCIPGTPHSWKAFPWHTVPFLSPRATSWL